MSTRIGAAVGFLAFLVLGAVPGLLYGGYLGLMMGNVLVGGAGASLLARMTTGGGMLLGFFAVGSVFTVAGALLGTLFGGVAVRAVEPAKEPV